MKNCKDCGKEIELGMFCSNCAWVGEKCWFCGNKPLYEVSKNVNADMCEPCWNKA